MKDARTPVASDLPPSPRVRPAERSAWRILAGTVWALYLRETRVRFGRYNLGLIWVLIDPLAQVAIWTLLFGFLLERVAPAEIPFPIFLLTGFLPYKLFTGIVTSSLATLRHNQALLIYSQVTPIDPFLARPFYEALMFIASIAVFLGVSIFIFDVRPELGAPMETIFALLSLGLLASGIGLGVGILAYHYTELEKIVNIALRPLFLLSCVLHPLESVPPEFQRYLHYNPITIAIETFRVGLFPDYDTQPMNLYYLATLALIALCLGLSFYWQQRSYLYTISSR